jgi:hypothetical protein
MKSEKDHKVLKLRQAWYKLKQDSKAWNMRIDNRFKENDFRQYPFERDIDVKSKKRFS